MLIIMDMIMAPQLLTYILKTNTVKNIKHTDELLAVFILELKKFFSLKYVANALYHRSLKFGLMLAENQIIKQDCFSYIPQITEAIWK